MTLIISEEIASSMNPQFSSVIDKQSSCLFQIDNEIKIVTRPHQNSLCESTTNRYRKVWSRETEGVSAYVYALAVVGEKMRTHRLL